MSVNPYRFTALFSGVLLATCSAAASAAVDEKLLDMLKANGSITPAQYSELRGDLQQEQQARAQVGPRQVRPRREGPLPDPPRAPGDHHGAHPK